MPAPEDLVIRDVSAWPARTEEQMGSKRKVWLEGPDGASYLFKYVRQDQVRGTYGDDRSEKLAAELAGLLGVPAAEVELAEILGAPGVICRRLNDPGVVELAHGNELLGAREPGYDKDHKREHPQYTVDAVRGCLGAAAPPSDRPGLRGLSGFDVWAGFLVFDAWIANTDRHHENWGVLIDRRDRSARLAPSFDHGSSLGFNVPEAAALELIQRPGAVDRWCRKGRSGHFSGRPTLVGVAAEALDLAGGEVREHWLSRLHGLRADDWDAVVDRIPAARMSEPYRTFVSRVLEDNRRRLLDVCHRAS